MKEINDIIRAFHEANNAGLKTALATVVKVEGSSYRLPGARMLVTETGQLTGAISGGCLEGDALRKALLAMNQQQNKLVKYDTSGEEDNEFGVQLGCNGIVHILFEPISYEQENNPVALLEQLAAKREPGVIVTGFSTDNPTQQTGTCLVWRANEQFSAGTSSVDFSRSIASTVETGGTGYMIHDTNGKTEMFLIKLMPPPVRLVIAGAGNDVRPLVEMATILGWEVVVADGRKTHATTKRFPAAKEVLVVKPAALLQHISSDPYTVFALMTHNYNYDIGLLKQLLEIDPVYLGILGPRKKFELMLEDLAKESIEITEEQLSYIHTPIGLDIGAETAEEIALSILSEIKAVLAGKKGTSLKQKTEKIHA
jgi:xanthine dehydrogenase accessory factor